MTAWDMVADLALRARSMQCVDACKIGFNSIDGTGTFELVYYTGGGAGLALRKELEQLIGMLQLRSTATNDEALGGYERHFVEFTFYPKQEIKNGQG